MKHVQIRRENGDLVCDAEVADGFVTRGVGLLRRKALAPDAGLLIQPCTSVHTFFMRFVIDVVYLDSQDRVVKAVTMERYRLSRGSKGTKRTLELAQGRITQLRIEHGERLVIAEDPGRSD